MIAKIVGISSLFIFSLFTPLENSDFLTGFAIGVYANDSIDYSVYDSLLKKYVSDGMVDYLKWKKDDFVVFESYVLGLKKVSLNNLSANEKKSFWINTYNALTIYAVLKHIPNNGILVKVFSAQMVPGFFDKIIYAVAGEKVTLNDIENTKLRNYFGDPRIHFVLVCASRSCPKIQNSAFKETGLEERLDNAAQNFIQDTSRNRLDKKNNVLHLSEIFKWYDSDFIASYGTVADFVKKYIGKEDSEHISSHTVKIQYLFYDWLVNIKR